MDGEIRDRIVMMLRSGDPEMRALAVILFCQQHPTFMDYFFIERKFSYKSFYSDKEIRKFLAQMTKCIK